MADLRVRIHDGPLHEFAAAWDALGDPNHPGAVFRSYPWIAAWWRHAAPSTRPRLLLAEQGREIVGLLPLYETGVPGRRRLRLMADHTVGSDYLGAVARDDLRGAVAAAFADELSRWSGGESRLDHLASDDPLVALLAAEFNTSPRYVCPYVAFFEDFDSYLARRPNGLARQWRRRLRWLEKCGGFGVRVLRHPDDVSIGIETLLDLHRRRWSAEGGSESIVGARVQGFHRDVARTLAERDVARVFLLDVAGAPRAALYGFRHGDRFAYYQSGRLPEWENRSVGTVLLGLVIAHCVSEGVREFDFLHGDEGYKLLWATDARHTVRLRKLSSWTARAEAQVRLAYVAAKGALPEGGRAWLRRQRNRLRHRLA